MTQRVLLLSAYDAESHRYWHQNLKKHLTDFDWHIAGLKDRFFSWRMAANAMNFRAHYDDVLSQQYDLLIVTSMTDLAAVRGFYPHLASIPNLLYFHENQFAYPHNPRQNGLPTIRLNSLMSAYLADDVVFNSDYNRQSFFDGAKDFLKKMPDGLPDNLIKSIQDKAQVLPVPIKNDCQAPESSRYSVGKTDLQVVWNHRWEHDKGPETLLALLNLCRGLPITFHIMGRAFEKIPKAMQMIKNKHADQCSTLGYVDSRADYIRVLQQADVVLSTAEHDFQGIAMLEAVACGCRPLAPDRLVYPDLYPPENLYPATPDDPDRQAQAIIAKLQNSAALKRVTHKFSWSHCLHDYRHWMQSWL